MRFLDYNLATIDVETSDQRPNFNQSAGGHLKNKNVYFPNFDRV